MAHHRTPLTAPQILTLRRELAYCLLATAPPRYDGPRIIGVDHLTAEILEERVALEACR